MIFNKEQASAIWCPMARVGVLASAGGPSAVNDPTVDFRGNCQASGCAMWRWVDPGVELRDRKTRWPEEDDPQAEPARPAGLLPSWEWVPITGEGEDIEGGYWAEPLVDVEAEHARIIAERRGYCGLAGAPAVIGGGKR